MAKEIKPVDVLRKAVKRAENDGIEGVVVLIVRKDGIVDTEWAGMNPGSLAFSSMIYDNQVRQKIAQ